MWVWNSFYRYVAFWLFGQRSPDGLASEMLAFGIVSKCVSVTPATAAIMQKDRIYIINHLAEQK